MPRFEEVEQHCASLHAAERRYCSRRVQREEARTHRVVQRCADQVARAAAEAEHIVKLATEEAEAAMSVAEARLQQEKQRQIKEATQAEDRLRACFAQTEQQVLNAQMARDAERLDVDSRILRADEASAVAVKAAKAQADATEALMRQRIEEAERREAVADGRTVKQRQEAEAKEVKRREESERMVQKLREDAQKRYRDLERMTAERVEACLQGLTKWLSRNEQAWLRTRGRVMYEKRRADKQTALGLALACTVGERAAGAEKEAFQQETQACSRSSEVRRQYGDWCKKELTFTAEEMEAMEGLAHVAEQLRADNLWRDLSLQEAAAPPKTWSQLAASLQQTMTELTGPAALCDKATAAA
eukprot:TRINITY_DN6468_c0_g1_i4.p1 TRINITY_DN6468_c0_g1~~TRINITY_DN6468_c0_g1_i4.p1  ORF type:complete len:360 (+),score=98.31 TRINITY_DN6468_c0_g1_i4:169-1248(+)